LGATRFTSVQFVDTNVLLYSISRDPDEAAKARRANAILAGGDVGLSVQVLQEFYVQSTRATRQDAISHDQAVGLIEALRRFPVQETTVAVMAAALATRRRFGISYWDAAIIEASRALGCPVVLSEDLDAGTGYDGVSVLNPFADPQAAEG
jgi:predicted nucleic acid-binding protein